MAPKPDVKGKAPDPKAKGQALPGVAQVSILDRTFPIWQELWKDDKEQAAATPDKYEDVAGLVLPPETQIFLDTWKRPEELVLNAPDVPMVLTVTPQPAAEASALTGKEPKAGGRGAPVLLSRELEGTLSAGHRTFEWLQAVFVMVMSVQRSMKPGEYLWELIYPKDKDGQSIKAPNGKYKVKLYIMDAWRTVIVDDRIPVDLFGRPLLVNARPIQLWPLLLSKAVLKVLAAHRLLHEGLPHRASAFHLLTGWPQEDLLDHLSGTRLSGGRLFDRLEDAIRGSVGSSNPYTTGTSTVGEDGESSTERRVAVAAVTLIKRALPERPPPRLIVLVGPSGVGRGKLLRRLVGEFPDKFGLTVSHTTRRPREHEVQGADYFFCEIGAFREEAAAGKLLEHAPVSSTAGSHLYGTSFATVREVAATGKLCLMGLDVQGVRSLRANKRIDGLYVFVAPPSMAELEARQRGRLKEADSTITKRLAWASDELNRATTLPGVVDHVVENGSDPDSVYLAVKEAISTLSPIIRNRLHGLPAYVLDYADLIAPNLVEKPFLKPVVVTGPTTGERQVVMEQLVREFPDVFAYPRRTTTKPYHEDALYRTDAGDRPLEQPAFEVMKTKDGEEVHVSRPTYTSVSQAEFDSMAKSGAFLQWHTELFKNPLVARRWGVTADAFKEVIRAGRLPLIECEVDGAAMLKKHGIDCLSIFLAPPDLNVYKERVITHLTETDAEIAARLEMARREMEAAAAPGAPFDATLVNDTDDGEAAYEELKRLISRSRPDIIVPEEDKLADPPPPPKQPILLMCGPAAAGRSAMARQLLSTFPDKFAAPGIVTDRKPAKGEVSTPALTFVSAKDLNRMSAEGQIAYLRHGEDKASGTTAITNAALLRVAAEGKVAVLELPDYGTVLPGLKEGAVLKDALYVFVASPGMLRSALEAEEAATAGGGAARGGKGVGAKSVKGGVAPLDVDGALADLDSQAQVAASAPEQYGAVVREDDMMDAISAVRMALSSHVPHVVPPPYRPLVVAGAFGTGKRRLLGRLFDALPGRFAVPLITTTRAPRPEDPDQQREGMVVVSRAEADAITAADGWAVRREVLGEVYGVTVAAVKKVGASGRVPVVEVDAVEDVTQLRGRGFDATYLFIGMEDAGQLLRVVQEELSANPPLGYELQDAVNLFFGQAKEQVAASRAPGLFDAWVPHDPTTPDPSFIRLAEAVHAAYPDVVTRQFVWGYGRQLWDPACRVHGQRPLRVMVLGPAASGKSTLCGLLAAHFGMPHVNVGELLFEEVRRRSELGLAAKEFMDASKTVPDSFFYHVLKARLAEPECMARGWALDGFPHTAEQSDALAAMGIVPDKVLLLDGEHAVLLDRSRHRRYDPVTGKVYHMPEPGVEALSPAIRPEKPDGSLDKEVVARLVPRHDDSAENMASRLALADRDTAALRDAYPDCTLRLAAAADPRQLFQQALEHLTLEARVPELAVLPSWQLKELQYLVTACLRHRRRQLLQLTQDDGRVYWVDAQEVLGGNAHCALLCQDPTSFPTCHQLRRVDPGKLSRVALLAVDSPEPVQLLASLFTGPQHPLLEDPPPPRALLVLAGPAGAGKSTALRSLLAPGGTAGPRQVELVPVLTSRPPLRREPAARLLLQQPAPDGTGGEVAPGCAGQGPAAPGALATACCVSREAVAAAREAGQLMAAAEAWDGHTYGVSRAALAAVWANGRLPVVEAPLELALALKELEAQEAELAAATEAAAAATAPLAATRGSVGAASLAGGLSSTNLTADPSRTNLLAPPPPEAPAPPPPFTARVAYLRAGLADLDVRLRLQDQREEAEVGRCLEAAAQEAEELARRAAAVAAAAASASSRTIRTPPGGATRGTPRDASPSRARSPSPMRSPAGSTPSRAGLGAAAGPFGPDLLLTASDPALTAAAVSRLAADSWARPRAQVAGQLVLEVFDWRAAAPGRTVARLRTALCNAGLVCLPRGRHLLRIASEPLLLHALTFMSASPATLGPAVGEYSALLPGAVGEEGGGRPHVLALEGRGPELGPGGAASGLLFRANLAVPERGGCTLAAHLAISGEALRAATRLLLVDRVSRAVTHLPGNRLHAQHLRPNAPEGAPAAPGVASGYCLMAVYDTGAMGTRAGGAGVGSVEGDGSYCLTVTSSAPLPAGPGGLAEVPSARCEAFVESYRPNARLVLGRLVLTTTASCQLALRAATEPPLPFSITLQEAPPGQEVSWAASPKYPLVASARSGDYAAQAGGAAGHGDGSAGAPARIASAADPVGPPPVVGPGCALLADVQLRAGKYVISAVLDGAGCPAGMQPDPVTGAMPGGAPVRVRLAVHPSADEKTCTVVTDPSHARYTAVAFERWNAAPVQLIPQPQPGQGGGAGGKEGKGAKAAGAGGAGAGGKASAPVFGPRGTVAAGMLDKHAAAQAALAAVQAAAAGGEGDVSGALAAGLARVLRDGSVLGLEPEAATVRAAGGAGDRAPLPLPREELAARQAAAAAAAEEGAARLAGVGRALEASRGERAGFKQAQASSFAAWREARVAAQREAAERRAQVAGSVRAVAMAAVATAAAK